MKPGDLVRLNSQGTFVQIISPVMPWKKHMCPVGTLAIIIEIEGVGKDGPSMETGAMVMVNNVIGWVWLYECEEIR